MSEEEKEDSRAKTIRLLATEEEKRQMASILHKMEAIEILTNTQANIIAAQKAQDKALCEILGLKFEGKAMPTLHHDIREKVKLLVKRSRGED